LKTTDLDQQTIVAEVTEALDTSNLSEE